MSPHQLRAARALLRLGIMELADLAGIAHSTITRYESERGGLQADTRDRLQAALQLEGVVFTPGNGTEPGVTLRKSPPPNVRPHKVHRRI